MQQIPDTQMCWNRDRKQQPHSGCAPEGRKGPARQILFQKQPQRKHELQSVADAYREATGSDMPPYYRPPQGVYSEENLKMAQSLGYRTVFWSLAYVDWKQDAQPTAEQAFSKLLPRIHPGAVVLLHSTSSTNAAILDELLTRWAAMGYRFGTLDELFASAAA